MKLISDVTIGEGEEVPPNSKFTKTWRIANSGEQSFPSQASDNDYPSLKSLN
jgi:hypothetical protein